MEHADIDLQMQEPKVLVWTLKGPEISCVMSNLRQKRFLTGIANLEGHTLLILLSTQKDAH